MMYIWSRASSLRRVEVDMVVERINYVEYTAPLSILHTIAHAECAVVSVSVGCPHSLPDYVHMACENGEIVRIRRFGRCAL